MKNSNIKHFYKLRYYLFLFLIAFGCTEPSEVLDKDITITEVQSAYSDIMNSQENGRQDSTGINWESAQYRETSQGDALAFSLDNVTNRYVSTEEGGTLYPVSNTAYAFAYKTEEDDIQLE
ncbi:MAG: hypothetical protein WBA74_11335, partial [Cyclobacteriaceae bacterium]